MAITVLHLARRAAHAKTVVVDDTQTRNLPRDVDRVVKETMADLADGQAKVLLAGIVHQADMLFARRESAFDGRQDETTQRHVIELVAAACATARELANLDASRTSAAASMRAASPAQLELTEKLETARTLLANRLSDAADARRRGAKRWPSCRRCSMRR